MTALSHAAGPPRAAEVWLPRQLRHAGLGRWAAANGLVAILYCTLGYAVSRFFAQFGLFPAPIWLPASIAVVAAMMGGLRMFPGLFLGSLIANYALFEPSLLEAVLISLTNALGPIAGAELLRRLRPASGLFNRFVGVVAFIGCAIVLHPALTATGGSFALIATGQLPLGALSGTWVKWWLSDSGGTLFFAPALLLWLGVEREVMVARPRLGRGDGAVWAGVAAVAVILLAGIPLHGSLHWAFPFLTVLPVSWIALRVSLRAAYSLISVVAVIASAGAVAGLGPFQGGAPDNPLQLVGILIVLLALNVLTIVSLVSERREAEESSRFKSMFLASASHDLRTPLNAILGFSDMMRSEVLGPLGTPRYHEYLDHIHESGQVLLNIVDDILDISKIEAGRREIAPRLLDGRAVAQECLDLVALHADAKKVALVVEAAPGIQVFADDLALRQILLNLLSNAVAFTPAGGTVTVRMTAGPSGATTIDVTDTGVGMNEDDIRVALEPFGQVRGGKRPGEGGTGLGLPIALRLAELHGGKLTIDSAPGEGATVHVSLPPGP